MIPLCSLSTLVKQVNVPVSLDVNYIGKPNPSQPYGIEW